MRVPGSSQIYAKSGRQPEPKGVAARVRIMPIRIFTSRRDAGEETMVGWGSSNEGRGFTLASIRNYAVPDAGVEMRRYRCARGGIGCASGQ